MSCTVHIRFTSHHHTLSNKTFSPTTVDRATASLTPSHFLHHNVRTALSCLLCRVGGDGRLTGVYCWGDELGMWHVWRRRETHTQFWWVNVQQRTALKTDMPVHYLNIQYILITGCRDCAVRGAVTRQTSLSASRSDRQCQSVTRVDWHCKRAVLDQVSLLLSLCFTVLLQKLTFPQLVTKFPSRYCSQQPAICP